MFGLEFSIFFLKSKSKEEQANKLKQGVDKMNMKNISIKDVIDVIKANPLDNIYQIAHKSGIGISAIYKRIYEDERKFNGLTDIKERIRKGEL